MKTYSNDPRGEQLLSVACDVCGSKEHSPGWDCGAFSFVRCAGCGVLYQNPQPIQIELLDRYDDDYFRYEIENEKPFLELQLLGLADVNFDTLSRNFSSEKTFLDIGCATGLLLDHQKRLGWAVQGVEVCRPSAEYGQKARGLDIFIGTLEKAAFLDSSFDVIHFSHLIEHLNHPAAFLREVSRILKPGGVVLVTTPNCDGLQARWFQAAWRSAIADHLYLFSKRTLKLALEGAGLLVRRVQTWGGLAKGAKPRFLKPFLDRFVKMTGWGDVVLIAAEKPRNR